VHKFKPSTIAQNILIPNGETPLPKFSPTQTLVLSVHKFKPCTIAQNILIPNGKTPLPKFSPIQTLALLSEDQVYGRISVLVQGKLYITSSFPR